MRVTRVVVAGAAEGPVVVLDEPLSFWGGLDPETGLVIDAHHPQVGSSLRDAVVVMPAGRGSSSASSVITEAARLGTAPAALVMRRADDILATGAIVADELYGRAVPLVEVDEDVYAACAAATSLVMTAAGELTIR